MVNIFENNIKISAKDHENFILASQDKNYIHTKIHYAKKFGFNSKVVHGINLMLQSMEYLLSKKKISLNNLYSIKVIFFLAVLENEDILIYTLKKKDNIKIDIYINKKKTTSIDLIFKKNFKPNKSKKYIFEKFIQNKPQKQTIDKIIKNISIPIFNNQKNLKNLFPNLFKLFGYHRLNGIILISTSVGMYWPGYYSLLTSCKIYFKQKISNKFLINNILVDRRFMLTNFNYNGLGIEGKVDALFKGENIKQSNIVKIRKKVKKNQFQSQNSIIIGGSKGLGEIASKLIISGGGKVCATYAHNKNLAKSNFNQLNNQEKKHLKLSKFVINNKKINSEINFSNTKFNVLYYFATPVIFRRSLGLFDNLVYQEFYNFYCKSFEEIVEKLISKNKKLIVFYPSTIAINQPIESLSEYIMAKKQGEKVCRKLLKKYKSHVLKIIIKRLPGILTDQTSQNWMLRSKKVESESLILKEVKKIHKLI